MTNKNWFDEALRLYSQGLGYKKISKELGVNLKTVENRFANWKKKNGLKIGVRVDISNDNLITKKIEDNIPKQETIEIHSNGSQTSSKLLKMNEQQNKNPAFLLEAHGYDSKEWMILSSKSSIWNTNSKENGIQDLYSSKITVKPLTEGIKLEDIENHFKNYKPHFNSKSPIIKNSKKMFELPIVDLHIGKMAWGSESGENFDSKILKDNFYQILSDILNKISGQSFEKIIFPFGNDLLNTDNMEGNTTGGTRQDNDLRIQKMFNIGSEMMIDMISELQKIAPVEVLLVTGNHSRLTEFYLSRLLEAYFRNCSHITFDNRPCKRKYVEYGNSLIGFSHGETEKTRIGGLMPVEVPEMWGRTKYREFHLGHLHSEQAKQAEGIVFKKQIQESDGLIIRHLPSITGSDVWHYNSAYVGAIRKTQGFIYDKEYGLTDILNFVVKK